MLQGAAEPVISKSMNFEGKHDETCVQSLIQEHQEHFAVAKFCAFPAFGLLLQDLIALSPEHGRLSNLGLS